MSGVTMMLLFNRLMKIHSKSPRLYYGFNYFRQDSILTGIKCNLVPQNFKEMPNIWKRRQFHEHVFFHTLSFMVYLKNIFPFVWNDTKFPKVPKNVPNENICPPERNVNVSKSFRQHSKQMRWSLFNKTLMEMKYYYNHGTIKREHLERW